MNKENLNSFIEFQEERFTKRIVFKEKGTTAFVLNFKPGQSLPAHNHPGSVVYLQLLRGEGTFAIDSKETTAKENDVLVLNGEEELSFINNSSTDTSLYVILTKIPGPGYAENV